MSRLFFFILRPVYVLYIRDLHTRPCAAGGDAQGLYTASPVPAQRGGCAGRGGSSRATRWLRAGDAPCGRLARKPRLNHVLFSFRSRSVHVPTTFCFLSSALVFRSCYPEQSLRSAGIKTVVWGSRASADGSSQELTPWDWRGYGDFKTVVGPLHGSVISPCEDSGSWGQGPKGPVGSPVSFPKRSNPAWRLVALSLTPYSNAWGYPTNFPLGRLSRAKSRKRQ